VALVISAPDKLVNAWKGTPTKWYPIPIAVGALLLVAIRYRKKSIRAQKEVQVDKDGREVIKLRGPWQVCVLLLVLFEAVDKGIHAVWDFPSCRWPQQFSVASEKDSSTDHTSLLHETNTFVRFMCSELSPFAICHAFGAISTPSNFPCGSGPWAYVFTLSLLGAT
jgi:hypothetical protein